MADTQVTISGNLTDDPELRFTGNGIAVCNFDIAVTERRRVDGEWQDGDTSFFRVNAWRGLAENATATLAKGMRVLVVGTLKQRSWETPEGQTRKAIEITADDIGPSVKWSVFTKDGGEPKSGQKVAANSSGRGRGRGKDAKVTTGGNFDTEPPF